jgi:hypothetical protein
MFALLLLVVLMSAAAIVERVPASPYIASENTGQIDASQERGREASAGLILGWHSCSCSALRHPRHRHGANSIVGFD